MVAFYIVLIGLVLFLGSALQGAVGFAYGLFGLPILVWLGLDLSHAVALMSVSLLVQVLVGVHRLRHEIQWSEVVSATLIRASTIPIGITLLTHLTTFDGSQVKKILGLFLLVVMGLQLVLRVKPRDYVHPLWKLIAFSCSGVMHGMVAMGGPPVVLWVMAHHWSSRQSRAFMFALFMLVVPPQVTLLYWSFGEQILSPMVLGLIFAPITALGAWVGVRLGDLFSKTALRQATYAILFFIAFASIFSSWG